MLAKKSPCQSFWKISWILKRLIRDAWTGRPLVRQFSKLKILGKKQQTNRYTCSYIGKKTHSAKIIRYTAFSDLWRHCCFIFHRFSWKEWKKKRMMLTRNNNKREKYEREWWIKKIHILGEAMSSISQTKHFSSNSRVILVTICESTRVYKNIGRWNICQQGIKRIPALEFEFEIKFFVLVSIRVDCSAFGWMSKICCRCFMRAGNILLDNSSSTWQITELPYIMYLP